ncbi:fap1 adhesin-like [Battus philenor]|uniref:fap1 adhesin-like n=1 Tax=Battus philenor TaxID=42288 RepID=UPI0035CF2440
MKFHLVYRNGRYESVVDDNPTRIESIDQGVSDRTSPPIEVFIEVPRFIESTIVNETDTETSLTTLKQPRKEFRPFSKQFFDTILHEKFPNPISNDDASNQHNFNSNTKFKLPISNEYDPEGKNIKSSHKEQRTKKINKVKEEMIVEDKQRDLNEISYDKTNAKYVNGETDYFETDNHILKNELDNIVDDVKITARNIIKRSIEKALNAGEGIIKEIDTKIKKKDVCQSEIETSKQFLSNEKLQQEIISNTTHSNTEEKLSDITTSVKETVELYEKIDLKPQETTIEEIIEDERKQFLLQEIKETIEIGSVRKKSLIFENDGEKIIDASKTKDASRRYRQESVDKKIRLSKYLAQREAYSIGLKTIANIRNIEKSTFHSTLLKKFFLYFTNIMVAIARLIPKSKLYSFEYLKTNRSIQRKESKTNAGFKILDQNKTTYDTTVHNYEENQQVDENETIRRRLSGCEMAQMVLRKPKDLTQRMETVITEFQRKLNIKDSRYKRHNERRSKSCSRIEEMCKIKDRFEWLNEMNTEEREQVKKDIKLAALDAARRVLENRRALNYSSENEYKPEEGLTYIAIVESHVYTNKNAIFNDYISRFKTETSSILDVNDYTKEEFLGTCSKLLNNSKNRNSIYFVQDDRAYIDEGISEYLDVAEDTVFRTDYVATVTVEYKHVPIIIEKNEIVTNHAVSNLNTITATSSEQINNVIEVNVGTYTVPIVEENEIRKIQDVCKAIDEEVKTISDEIKDSVVITEIIEDVPTVTIQPEELKTAQAVGKETLRQISAVFSEAAEVESEHFNNENVHISLVEDEKLLAAQIVNQIPSEENYTLLDQVEIDSVKELSSSMVTNDLTTVKVMGQSVINQINIDFDTVESKETKNVSDEIQMIIPNTEAKELTKVKSVNIATLQHTNQIFNESINETTIIGSSKELPAVTLEAKKLSKAHVVGKEIITQTNVDLTEASTFDKKINYKEEKLMIANVEPEFITANIVQANVRENTFEFNSTNKNLVEVKESTQTTINVEETAELLIENKMAVIIEKGNHAKERLINSALIEEVTTEFNQVDLDSVKINQNFVEIATSSLEIRDLAKVDCICISTVSHIIINYEEPTFIETKLSIEPEEIASSLEIRETFKIQIINNATIQYITVDLDKTDDLPIDKIEAALATMSLEKQEFVIVRPICTPVATQTILILDEVESFDSNFINGEIVNVTEELRDYFISQSFCTPNYQEMIMNEEAFEIHIDKFAEEFPAISSVPDELLTIFGTTIPFVEHISINFIETEAIDNESLHYQVETAICDVEANEFTSALAICFSICLSTELFLEESNVLNVEEFEKEFTTICVEPNVFLITFPIATPVLQQTSTTYAETQCLLIEDFKTEKAETTEVGNVFAKTLAMCVVICRLIELKLEEIVAFEIQLMKEQVATSSLEPQILGKVLPISTPVYSVTITNYNETQYLDIKEVQKESAETSEEENVFVKALATCIAISLTFELVLDKCEIFTVDEVDKQFTSVISMPQYLFTSLPLCTPVYKEAIVIGEETQILEIENIQKYNSEITVESSKFISIIARCFAVCRDISIDLEESRIFTQEAFKTESVDLIEQSKYLVSGLSTGISIISQTSTTYNIAEEMIIETPQTEEAKLSIEIKDFMYALPMCISESENISVDLIESINFEVENIEEVNALSSLEPNFFVSTISICTPTLISTTLPVHEVVNLDQELITEITALSSLETEDYVRTLAICQSTAGEVDIVFYEVKNYDFSYNVTEEHADIDVEINQYKSILPINISTVKWMTYDFDVVENLKDLERKEEHVSYKISKEDSEIALAIAKATAEDKRVSLYSVDKSIDYKSQRETAVETIEDNMLNIASSNIEAIHTIVAQKQDENLITDIKREHVSLIESRHHVDSYISTQATIKDEDNNQSITKEANLNLTLRKKSKEKLAGTYESSSELYLFKIPLINESVTETIEETLHIRKVGSKKSLVEEECQENIIKMAVEDLEEESGVTIQDITDLEENTEEYLDQTVIEEIDNAQELTQDMELKYLMKNKKNQQQNANTEESAALTIIRKEEVDVVHPVLKSYDEDNLIIKEVIDVTESSDAANYKSQKTASQSTATNLQAVRSAQTEISTEDFNERSSVCKSKKSSIMSSKINVQAVHSAQQDIGIAEFNEQSSVHKSKKSSSQSSEINLQTIRSAQREIGTKEYIEQSSSNSSETLSTRNVSSASQDSSVSTVIAASVTKVSTSAEANKMSSGMTINTNTTKELSEERQSIKDKEVTEVQSPSSPPTPLTDEYIFRLVAPLPKSRGTTPIPIDLNSESSENSIEEDPHIVKKNLVPTIENVTIERVTYSPPLPTPPTSPGSPPVYTKPGLNGGSKCLPRYIKPGLRGGSDRPPITKEEILEVQKLSSLLTSAITETLKDIEKYKKEVGLLKQQKDKEDFQAIMEADDTTKADVEQVVQQNVSITGEHSKEVYDIEGQSKGFCNVNKEENQETKTEGVVLPKSEDISVKIEECIVSEDVEDKTVTEMETDKCLVEFPLETSNENDLDEKDKHPKIVVESQEILTAIKEEELNQEEKQKIIDDDTTIKESIADEDVAADLEVASKYKRKKPLLKTLT